jgi:ent-kaurene oxidase
MTDTAVQRVAVVPWTFKDGLTIPAGTKMAFPNYHYGRDATFNPQPDVFDPRRHLRMREEHTNSHKFHFASVSEESMNFWAGRHACPGRFFAQETLKLILIHLLTHYEIKHADETKETPRIMSNKLFRSPNPALPIQFKEYKEPL